VALAEIERRFGKRIARVIANGGGPADFDPNRRPPGEAALNRHNHEIGVLIGRRSPTLGEIIERTRKLIGLAARGGRGETVPAWFPAREWRGGGTNWPPAWQAPRTGDYAFGDEKHVYRFGRRRKSIGDYEIPRAPVARPVEIWSVDDLRAAMRSETYRNAWDPEYEEGHRLVDRWHELFDIDGRPRRAGGKADPVPCAHAHQIVGRIPVRAHTRVGVIPVCAHDRARRRSRPGTELRKPGP
ncbi:MAG: hypothetical protein HXY30_03390, partial [Pseudorhodoplanes sp.]|nr:hypothetical protein [Pseudorhodoplanes sp.]